MSAPANEIEESAKCPSRRASHRNNRSARRSRTQPPSISAFTSTVIAAPHLVELQVETMSSVSTHIFLYSWYAMLIIALVVESNVGLQWVSRNFCGDATVSAYHLEDWNSTACLSWEAYWVRPSYEHPASPFVDAGKDFESAFDDTSVFQRHDIIKEGAYAEVAWPSAGEVMHSGTDAVGPSQWCSDEMKGREIPPSPGLPSTDNTDKLFSNRRMTLRSLDSRMESIKSTTTTSSAAPSPSPHPTMPPLRRVYKLRWTAEALSGVMDYELNRFLHVFISLASPLAQHPPSSLWKDTVQGRDDPPLPPPLSKTYEVSVALEETSVAPPHTRTTETMMCGNTDGNFLDMPYTSSKASSSSSSSSSSDHNDTRYIYTYKTSVTCWRTAMRCNNIVLPSNVVIPTNGSRLTVTLIGVEAELAEATVRTATVDRSPVTSKNGSNTHYRLSFMQKAPYALQHTLFSSASPTTGVGVMYQRANYTIATVFVRYLFLAVTIVSALRFLYRSRQAHRMLYEQKWTLALQLGLMLYLNPLYWSCIYTGEKARGGSKNMMNMPCVSGEVATGLKYVLSNGRGSPHMSWWHVTLYYIEFHIPTYFVAFTVCYVWGVIAGSFRWSAATKAATLLPSAASPSAAPSARVETNLHINTNADELSTIATVPLAVTVLGSRLVRRRVRVLMLVFMLVVAALDAIKFFLAKKGSTDRWGEVVCRTPHCLTIQQSILYVLIGGILSSGVGLYWLRRNLARHPYLSTRPQQLACRIMIFMYFTGGLYCVVQMLLLETLYTQLIRILYYKPLVQLSHLLVLTSFVNHMTYVYTTTQSSLQIPLRPSDPRWKTVGWSSRWYRWLDWHGGSMYVFFNESEERRFYEVQVAYHLTKHERKAHGKRNRKENKTTTNRQREEARPQQPLPPLGSNQSFRAYGDGAPEGNSEHANTAEKQGRGKQCENRDGFFSCSIEGHDEVGNGTSSPDCLSASAYQHATVWSNTITPQPATRIPPQPCIMSANTLSALSDAEVSDWLLMPEGGLPRRQRTLSTVTQPSSNTTESSGYHQHSRNEEEVDDRSVLSKEGTAGCVNNEDGVDIESLTPSLLTPPGAFSFPPVTAPSATTDKTRNSGDGKSRSGDNPNAESVAKERLSSSHRVSSRVFAALHNAESRLVDGTATFVDLLAEKCVDRPLQVLLRQRARQRFVFFNLETAIDCLNLSREAYAVQESRGDDLICTGIQVDAGEVPRAALTLIERAAVALFGLCFAKFPVEPSAVSAVVAVENEDREGVGGAPNDVRVPLLNRPEEDASRESEQENSTRKTSVKSLLRWFTFRKKGSTTVVSSPERPAETVERFATPVRPQQHEPSPASTPTPTFTPSQLLLSPHMNVEQYGYHPVAVFDTRGVQVVVSRMDVSGAYPVHIGKHPRLTIAFRGTDNVANALEDIRFQQRTWKEMETPTLLPRAKVHSGFLELWMSLKEAVMGVVLQELRNQHAASCEGFSVDEATIVEASLEAAAPSASAAVEDDDAFHSTVPFSTRWTAPAKHDNQERSRSGYLRVYVTGHSLGGALACLCAYSLRRMLLLIGYPEPDLVVYTFGQPRIGNSVFKQHYNRAVPCTFRVVNESDAVSGFNLLGGHHVGVQVNVDRHGNYICKPMYIERLLRPTRGRGLALLNHKLAAYANSLNAVADVYAGGACPVRCLEPYMDDIESVGSSAVDEEGEEGENGTETVPSTQSAQREEIKDA